MLAVVAILVFVAFGMVVVASTTGTAALAWVSVVVSVVAAAALAADWRRRWTAIGVGDRMVLPARDLPPIVEYPAAVAQGAPWQQECAPVDPVELPKVVSDAEQEGMAESATAQSSAAAAPAGTAGPAQVVEPAQAGAAIAEFKRPGSLPQLAPEPGEESADAAAVAIVAKLDDEVHVVDEQPRYHLADCHALVGQKSIAMPAKEAVGSEFTPCEMCTPVRVLVSAGSLPGSK